MGCAQAVRGRADHMTNELIGEINRFDPEAIAKAAREYKPR
jgi:hypothetical protein